MSIPKKSTQEGVVWLASSFFTTEEFEEHSGYGDVLPFNNLRNPEKVGGDVAILVPPYLAQAI